MIPAGSTTNTKGKNTNHRIHWIVVPVIVVGRTHEVPDQNFEEVSQLEYCNGF
jgi:primosomal replication protein N